MLLQRCSSETRIHRSRARTLYPPAGVHGCTEATTTAAAGVQRCCCTGGTLGCAGHGTHHVL